MPPLLTPGSRVRQLAPSRGVNGIGAGVTAWTPANEASLAAWYTADPQWCFSNDAGTTPSTATGVIAVWKDRSGLARPNWVQTTNINRPTLEVATGGYEMRFNRLVGHSMSSGSWAGVFSGAGTIGLRIRTDYIASQQTQYMTTGSTADSYTRFLGTGTYDNNLRGARVEGLTPLPSLGVTTQIYRSSAAGWNRWENGAFALSDTANFSVGNTWTIGGAPEGKAFDGAITEIVVFTAVLSDAVVVKMHNYLSLRL